MKLHEGVYENLITGQLQASMKQATDEGLGAIPIRLLIISARVTTDL